LDSKGHQIASYGDGNEENLESIISKKNSGYYVKERAISVGDWKIISVIPLSELFTGSSGLYINTTVTYLCMILLVFYIHKSQKRMYEMELSKRRIQILAYRNQINPHFLYNTFDCIRAMALFYDAEDIAEITMSLSDVFRYAVKEENIVLVEEEIEYIQEYAKIIEFRFDGKIRVHIQADEYAKKEKMVKLLLQPLVENAVFHGVEKNMHGGDIYVTVRVTEENSLSFCVQDNGPGMSESRKEEVLSQLTKKSDEEKKKGIGLANIYGRLKLFYGDQMRFSIETEEGRGTKVMITVPNKILGV